MADWSKYKNKKAESSIGGAGSRWAKYGGGGDDSAQDRLNKAVEAAEDEGLGDWAKGVAGDGLSLGGKVLGTGLKALGVAGSTVASTALELGDAARALTGQDPLGDRGRIKDRGVSLRDIVDNVKAQVGVGDIIEHNTVTDDLPLNAKRAIGFVGDVALDPLTYVTAGASVAAQGGRRGVTLLGRDQVATRLLNLSDEALAAAGTTREVAERAAGEVAQSSAGRLGRKEFDQVRAALGPDVRIGVTFNFGRLGSPLVSTRGAAVASKAGSVAKKTLAAPVVKTVGRTPGGRAALDEFIAKWETIPGLRKLRRENPVVAVKAKNTVVRHRAASENFLARWSRAFEGLRDEFGETVDADTLRRALEDPASFGDEALPEAAGVLRGFMDQMLAEAEAYTGKTVARLENYLPHQLTYDMLRYMGGDQAFTDLMKKRGLSATDFGAGGINNPKTIDAINDAAREVFGDDFVKLFETDPWFITGHYISSVGALFRREGVYGALERAGLAQTMFPQFIDDALKKSMKGRKLVERQARAAGRQAERDAQKASKAEVEAIGASVRQSADERLLGQMRRESDELLARLEVVTQQMVRRGMPLEEAQAEAIRKTVAADPQNVAKLTARLDAKIGAVEEQIELIRAESATAYGVVHQVEEAMGEVESLADQLLKRSDELSGRDAAVAELEETGAQLRLLKERFEQEAVGTVTQAEEALGVSIKRYIESKGRSVRGLVEGGSGENHARNLAALSRDARRLLKAGGDPHTVIKAAAREFDAGVDGALLNHAQAAMVGNAEIAVREELFRTVDGLGQWVPETPHDDLVKQLARALGAEEDPIAQTALRAQLAKAQGDQRFGWIKASLDALKDDASDEARAAFNELSDLIARSVAAAGRDGGGLSAQRRVMRALFSENEMGEARGALARAMDVVRRQEPKAAQVPPTGGGLPPLFHGSSTPIAGGKPVRYAGRSAENLYGPGFYTTDAPELAGKYTRKGRGSEPTIYDVKFNGGTPRILDAEAPMSEDAATITGRWLDAYLDDADLPIEDLDELRRMTTEGGTLEGFYAAARDALSYGERETSEVSELLGILNENLSESFDAIRHTGGKITKGQPHNVFVWLNPDDLQVLPQAAKASGQDTARAGAGIIDSTLNDFERVLATNKEARQAAYEATLRAGADYAQAKAKADVYEQLMGVAERTVKTTEGKVTQAAAKLDTWIEKKAAAMAEVDDVASGWPTIGLTDEKITEESRALIEAFQQARRGAPHEDGVLAKLQRSIELEAALADAKDPTIRALIKQERASELAQAKAEIAWGKKSAWDRSAKDAADQRDRLWNTAREIGAGEAQVEAYVQAWRHQFREFAGRENLWAERELVEMVGVVARLSEPQRATGLLRLHDQVLARWKAYALMSPGYHSRNFFSAVWMNGLAGMSGGLGQYTKFGRAWSKFLKDGEKAALDSITDPQYRKAFKELIDNQGYMFGDTKVRDLEDAIGTASNRGLFGGKEGSKRRMLDPTALDNKAIRTNFAAAHKIESWVRGPLFLDGRLKGLSVDESLERVMRFHFDYSDLSFNEKKYMKRLVPFYTWTRKNLPLQLEMIAKRPGYYSSYGHAQENLEIGTPLEAIVPSYYGPFAIRSPFQAKDLPYGEEGGDSRMYWMPDLPFTSLDDVFDFGKIRGQLTPLIKAPWELDRGAQFFSGAPFTDDYKEVPKTWEFLAPLFDGLDGRFGLPNVKRVEGKWFINDRDAYKIEQALPLLGRSRRLAPSEDKYQARMLTSWLSIMGGIGAQTNTLQTQESELLRRVRHIESRLKRRGQLADGVEEAAVESEA